jgi:hypothetical protein
VAASVKTRCSSGRAATSIVAARNGTITGSDVIAGIYAAESTV